MSESQVVSQGTRDVACYTGSTKGSEFTFVKAAPTFAELIVGDSNTIHLAVFSLAQRVAGSLRFPTDEARDDAVSDGSIYAIEHIATIRSARNPESMGFDIIRKRMVNGLRNEGRRKHAPLCFNQEYHHVFSPTLIEVRAAREPRLLTETAKLRQLNTRITKAIKAAEECTNEHRERVEGFVEALQILRRMWYGSYRVCRLSSVRFTKTDRIPLNDN